MWKAFGRNRTTVTCWFCNEPTQLPPTSSSPSSSPSPHQTPQTPQDWHCTKCDNQNTLDAHGHIVDSRAEMYSEPPPRPPRQPPAAQQSLAEQVFCSACQRNQELVCQILAAYLPDEDDPEYGDRADNAEEYAGQLRRRYPLVCRACQVRVDRRLQQQAQWVYRRELASALQRSARAKRLAARILRPQPTLRRKWAVLMWVLCALVALVACPVATWAVYLGAYAGVVPLPVLAGAGLLALAALTFLSRLVNPLWLYIACSPGMRAAGLPMYRRRVAQLAFLRLLAACLLLLPAAAPHVLAWPVLAAADLALCWLAASNLRTHSGRRRPNHSSGASLAPKGSKAAARDGFFAAGKDSTTPGDAQLALASLQNLSFGVSEANRDQDDSFSGLDLAAARSSAGSSPWAARASARRRAIGNRRRLDTGDSSGDDNNGNNANESTFGADIMAGLNTLSVGSQRKLTRAASAHRDADPQSMDVDPVSSLLSGSSFMLSGATGKHSATAAGSAEQPPRPFVPKYFNRQHTTGLETKMSSFSLNDSDDDNNADDGSYQGILGSTAMDSWLLGILHRRGSLLLRSTAAIGLFAATVLLGSRLPMWLLWVARVGLAAAVAAAVLFSSTPAGFEQNTGRVGDVIRHLDRHREAQNKGWLGQPLMRRILGCTLLMGLVGIPAVFIAMPCQHPALEVGVAEDMVAFGLSLLPLRRWALARQMAGDVFRSALCRMVLPDVARLPPVLIQLDCVVELACLVFILL
ncbi:hypothetical protein LPJ66_004935 [Kickxella alabastrina]|uniref:Uncharacterized protein n=1 Tax=Kickxella alabastrina TaxID=61397 RepID=A0ACC1IGL3_9FUNG|nr:hypothetical protein LPJ66_004935 [Kickxella alabastrina]